VLEKQAGSLPDGKQAWQSATVPFSILNFPFSILFRERNEELKNEELS
jgi:hypothetical protein